MWTGQCQVSRSLSDGKHMSSEVERKTQPQSSLDSVTIQWRGKKGCRHVFLPFLCLSQLLPTMSRLFLLFPRNSISRPTRSAKKKKRKKKAAFHFRVHLVPKICKVLNQEVPLSQLHTEPFILFWVRITIRKFLQLAQLIRHSALDPCAFSQTFLVSNLKITSRCPPNLTGGP